MSFFKTREEWKSALMTLPDSDFFELLKSILGNIKTPFNKQRLLEELSNFLSRKEIQKIIAGYISEEDHKIIAAIALLDEPAPGILETFFSGEFSYAQLQAIIVNLEERLIVYRFRDNDFMRLALNPVLEEVLAPFIKDTRPILPSGGAKTSSAKNGTNQVPYGRMNDARYMASVFAFAQNEEELFKNEVTEGFSWTIRKKANDEWKKIFKRLDLDLALKTLIQLGLFKNSSFALVPLSERIFEFCAMEHIERQEYWIAAMYFCLNETPDAEENAKAFTGVSKSRLRAIASFIHRFRASLEAEKSYSETTLRRLLLLLEKESASGKTAGKDWGYSLFETSVRLNFETLLSVMETSGLLEKEKTNWQLAPIIAETQAAAAKTKSSAAKPVLSMDSAFSMVLYPEISFADAIALGAFCSVKEIDSVTRFALTRQSAVRAFDNGMKSAQMLELLNRLSGGRVDTNLGWTLKEWEKRYEEVTVHEGIVLRLAKDRLYLAEAEPVSSMIQRSLAPGVYLLSSANKACAAKALRKAGVDIIAQPSDKTKEKHPLSRDFYPKLAATGASRQTSAVPKAQKERLREKDETFAASHLEKLREALGRMKLTKEEREELSARIERRMVLTEAQMDASSLRYEKTEARLLDYRGKIAIAKNAIDSHSLVEVVWTDTGKKPKQITGIAKALEKKEGDSILVVEEVGGSAKTSFQETIRIPLGKISFLKRIKQSIFGG